MNPAILQRYQDAAFKRAARKACGARANMPLDIIEGCEAPSIQGEPGGYVYGEGYEGSTMRVVVGVDWQITNR